MTLSVVNRDPASGATGISPKARVRFSIVTDDLSAPVDVDTLFVRVNGRRDNGVVESDGFGGVNVTITPPEPLVGEELSTVIVAVSDTNTIPLNETWTFTSDDKHGPLLATATPVPFSAVATSPVTMVMRFTDPGGVHDPVAFLNAWSVTGNVEHVRPGELGPANQVLITPTGSVFFTGTEGQQIAVGAARRNITSVQGPGLATYDGAQLFGVAATVAMRRPCGLDVFVDGVRVVHNGEDAGAGWAAVIAVVGDDIQVTLTPPVTWPTGKRVPVHAVVPDANGNFSAISWTFDVVDVRGPVVTPVSPAPSTRGLSVTGVSLVADVIAGAGATVGTTTINVLVDGVPAVASGVFQAGYTGTINPVTGGYRVTVNKTAAYVDGRVVVVDVRASDTVGRTGERRAWSVQFGTSLGIATPVTTAADVVRVVAFDLSTTPFGDPVRLRHTGYAWDGRWYTDGNRDDDLIATWWTELGDFPMSGHVVATGTLGWKIFRGVETAAWASCAATAVGWSMAGSVASARRDASFEAGVLTISANDAVFETSFVDDKGYRHDNTGRRKGTTGVSGRNGDQTGFLPDLGPPLPAGPYTRVARGADGSLIVATALRLSVITDGVVYGRDYPGTWSRVRRDVWAYNDGGQGQVEIWNLDNFRGAGGPDLFLDDATTPALNADVVNDVALVDDGLVVASPGDVRVIDKTSLVMQAFPASLLGLTAAGAIEAVDGERGMSGSFGHIHVGTGAPGRVVRFRIHAPSFAGRSQQLSDTVPVTSLATVGVVRAYRRRYVRASMVIAP